MERMPYQGPQTSMERHLIELVEHVRNGTDNRSGFAQKIEAAQEHAFWLEKHCAELREEVRKLERAMMPALPAVRCRSEEIENVGPMARHFGAIAFDWELQAIRWRGMWPMAGDLTPEVAQRVKRRTFREVLRLFRKEFERTWTLNASKRFVA